MNYHILDINAKGDAARVAFHFPIPASGTNNAGKQWRAAYQEWRDPDGAGIASAVPDLETSNNAEFIAIQAGQTIEHVETVHFSAATNNAQKQAAIESRYSEIETTILPKIQAQLSFWGFAANVS